jgi:hypothetical protein
MPRPGTDVFLVDDAPASGAVLDTGQAFFVGQAERGPVGSTLRVTSQADYAKKYGARPGGSLLYDAAGAFFREGGGVLYISRAAAADAVVATKAFGTATVNATSPGVWGNDVAVAIDDVGVVTVSYQDVPVERSSVVTTMTELATWSARSSYVRIVKGATDVLPAADTTVDLAGGANGAAIGTDEYTAALAAFDYGIGQGDGQPQHCGGGNQRCVSCGWPVAELHGC